MATPSATAPDVTATLEEPPSPPLPVSVQTLLFGRYRHRFLPAMQRRYGDVFTLRIAPHRRRLVMVCDPADIRTVFAGSATVFHAGEGNAILGPVMGPDSVLLLDEDGHARVRRLLMPAFHGAALQGYTTLIDRLAEAEVGSWEEGTLAGHDRMQALTLEIILQVVFGVTDSGGLAQLRPVVAEVVTLSPLRMLGWFYPPLRRFWPWRGFATIQQRLDDLLYAEIAQRRSQPDLADRNDVLSSLLHVSQQVGSGGGLTDQELRDNLITLLLAGHETTATALAWTMLELAADPAQLTRAQQAADSGDTAYLQACVRESLRLHPIIYEVARRLQEPVEIGGYRVRAGATVMPTIGVVQSDPRSHADPEQFDPTRFLGKNPAPNTWIPFGGGVRRCLGAGFAELEAGLVLRAILSRYDLALPGRREHPVARNITLAPSGGARLLLSRRSAR